MQPSKQELETAFKRVEATLRGVSFEQAMAMPAVVIGLKRMAINAQNPKAKSTMISRPNKPKREMWYDKF